MVEVVQMNKVVMKVKLSIIENKDASPTYFVFMSFTQVETYASLCVALKSKSIFD
jgi:hypothetical protein